MESLNIKYIENLGKLAIDVFYDLGSQFYLNMFSTSFDVAYLKAAIKRYGIF